MIKVEDKNTYEIFTDASFDNATKVGTYGIVIMQKNKILKTISKKCSIQLQNSLECEVYAIFQAINLIQGFLLKKKTAQKFCLRTDCSCARDFFVEKDKKIKIFKKNLSLLNIIRQAYERIKKALSKNECSFIIKWIPRESNKVAHKQSYSAFKKLKKQNNNNELLIIEKKSFLELLQKFNSIQYKILSYLFQNSNEQKLIFKTQREIAKSLDISVYSINKGFKELINLNILGKVKNGEYMLLM